MATTVMIMGQSRSWQTDRHVQINAALAKPMRRDWWTLRRFRDNGCEAFYRCKMRSKPRVTKQERARLCALLRARGLRCSIHRVAVLAELERADSPVTCQEMRHRLSDFHFDNATVFRNLKDFCDVGLAVRIDVGDHTWRFELRRESDEHPHFLCIACGEVMCLHDVSVADAARRMEMPAGIRTIEEMILKGRCDDCVSVPRG